MAEIRVGIAGWTFAPWRGNFYPTGLKQDLELAYASRRFNALEINGTYYGLQSPSSYQTWYESTPNDFVFAIKGIKYIADNLKLKEPAQPLANFFASGLLCLKEKLGPILWQFPPTLLFDEDRCKAFFDLLPRDTTELARLAKNHDSYVKKGAYLESDVKRPVRYAVEFRHASFLSDRFIDLLRKHNISLVIADADSKFPSTEDVTADFVYVRLHGERKGHASGYTLEEIETWAAKVKAWRQGKEPANARRIGDKADTAKSGRDLFVFFNNTEDKLLSPVNAWQMVEAVGVAPEASSEQVMKSLNAKANASPKTTSPRPKKPSKPKPAKPAAPKKKAAKKKRDA